MNPPVEGRRPVTLVVTVGLSVFLFACSATPQPPVETARFGMARSGEDPAPEPAVPEPQAVPAPPAAAVPAQPAPAAAAGPEAPAPQGPVTFGSVPQDEDAVAEPLTPRERPALGGSRVFSNKDLASYKRVKEEFGFRDNVLVVDASARKDAGRGSNETISPEERERLVSETREKIERLSQEMQYLRGRIPSLHNPFLPRAKVSDGDAVEEAGMDNAERLARVNQRITALASEMGGLQKQLADLMAMAPAGAAAPNPGN